MVRAPSHGPVGKCSGCMGRLRFNSPTALPTDPTGQPSWYPGPIPSPSNSVVAPLYSTPLQPYRPLSRFRCRRGQQQSATEERKGTSAGPRA
eukprot:CAMPEP_0195119734 /NCGR_PEP_ID=MMETSP0448-20130528/120207_1 /TAXON_ID=66468 /ORGANISM="Heterocapsa triquestra, Strain CCMP 448" /LENGTH=91 /DNA_ID=CAMNT_0040157093 /DNA_START=320 /DNA_END=591 /DNA_ORIENTATION=+